ncbi:hypothetical protein K437DRAFT_267377 [Tilletiaria anomala UBC 951]|uniref:MMS19 nucleotide excision repair protein n=1 Tax=Tilletiaria anomala (strain ATCC 24038 / CBS 436.72 / UBC 951) TaxID=1037660 RepID=A0A066W7M2_TILAU|nr:uncharacterized protein K437DRAFT_267377 [Tilletiaria anomala UBC 951]KDN49952.1 hypothetical protein K437DRAFT_267377 [Tilletiaria anomala UBC 951]
MSTSDSLSASPIDATSIRQEAYQSISTYLIPPSTQGSSAGSVLPPDELPSPVVTAVERRIISLLDLIKHMRDSLTSDNPEIRSLAVQLLSLVVTTFAPVKDLLPTSEASSTEAGEIVNGKPLFDKQAILTLVTFFSSKLEDGEIVAAEIARKLNASTSTTPASAGWSRQAAEGGAREGDKRWLGGLVPRGSEMLAAGLVALQRLICLDSCGSEAARTVAEALIEHVKPTDHPQALRFLIFKLLDLLVARHRAHALRSLGAKFLRGYISLAKGEKDPRNLMLLFATDRVLLIDFADLLEREENRDIVEAFFDITFCYFPITFRPPPDDPYGITSADLKAALRGCMTANARLAPHAMPLLLEKLSATGGAAKLDTLDTLREAFPIYGRAAVQAHEKALWENLKIEILHATDKETGLAAQETLVSMLACLYTIPDPVDPPTGLAPKIMAEMLVELESPEKVLAAPAASIVACLIRAGASTSYFGLYGAFERLLEMFKDPDEISLRAPILGHIATLLRSVRVSYAGNGGGDGVGRQETARQTKDATHKDDSSKLKLAFAVSAASSTNALRYFWSAATSLPQRSYETDRKPLDSFRNAILAALHNGIRSASYRANALAAFVQVCHIDDFLTLQEIGYLSEAINELLVTDAWQEGEEGGIVGAGLDEVRRLAMDALMDVAKINAKVLETTTLPLLFGKLPDQLSAFDSDGSGDTQMDHAVPTLATQPRLHALSPAEIRQRTAIRHSLGALARLGTQSSLFDILIVKLLTKFDLAVMRPCNTEQHRTANVGYARGLLSALYTITREKERRGDRDLGKYAAASIPRLLMPMLSHILEPSANTAIAAVAADASLNRDVGALLMLFSRSLSLEKQIELARKVYLAIEQGEFEQLLEQPRFRTKKDGSVPKTDFAPLSRDDAQRDMWYLIASIIIPFRQDVPLPFGGELLPWVERQLDQLHGARSLLHFDVCALSLASAINKHAADPLPQVLSQALQSFFDRQVRAAGAPRRAQSLRCWLYILKGLSIRNSKDFDKKLMDLIALCEDDSIGPQLARSFDILAKEDSDILTKANGHTVRLLYRQRLFSVLLPKVIDGYRTNMSLSDPSTRASKQSVYLIALTALLPHMPKATTQERLRELFPLLIQALNLPDAQTRGNAANTIAVAIIAAHIQKRRVEEEEVQSMTRRVAAGAHANLNAKASNTFLALTLAEDHIGSLISRLLAVIDPQQTPLEASRVAALRCLAALARGLPYLALHPHRISVQRALARTGTGVDDPRRKVRLEAVEARDAWFTLHE